MKTLNLTDTLKDQRLAPFLPLVAAVWDDGDLSDLEVAAVCMAIIRDPDMDLSCKEALQGWLDPNHPPSAHDLAALNSHVARSEDPASRV
jgi:hypothetical protein